MRVLVLVLVMVSAAIAAPVAGAVTQVTKLEVTTTQPNVCTGELVTLEGTFVFVFHESTDATGVRHLKDVVATARFKGTGLTSGTNYILNAPFSAFTTREVEGTPFQETGTAKFHLISQGSTDDLLIAGVFHITRNASGDLVVFMSEIRIDCLG
jgi:hypothetical protein